MNLKKILFTIISISIAVFQLFANIHSEKETREFFSQFVKVKSLAGESCVITPEFLAKFQVKGARNFKLKEIKKGTYEIDIKKGEEIILYSPQCTDYSIDLKK